METETAMGCFGERLGTALLLAIATGAGCSSIEEDDWRFRLSREFYPELVEKMDANEPLFAPETWGRVHCEQQAGFWNPASLLLVPIVIGAPLALDVAFFPVAAGHDAWVR